MVKRRGLFVIGFVFLIALFAITLASAQIETLGTYKHNDCIELKQTCSNCTYVNISSILFPNSTLAVNTDVEMLGSGTDYNYTFCDTDAIGQYIVNGYADVDGEQTVWAYDFKITNSGYDITEGYTGIISMVLLIIYGISIFFIIVAYKTPSGGFKVFFVLLSFVFLLLSMIASMVVVQSTGLSPALGTTLSAFIFVLGTVFFIMFVYALIKQTKEALDLYNFNRGLGMPGGNPYDLR